jgi:hypothetical protein
MRLAHGVKDLLLQLGREFDPCGGCKREATLTSSGCATHAGHACLHATPILRADRQGGSHCRSLFCSSPLVSSLLLQQEVCGEEKLRLLQVNLQVISLHLGLV